MHIFRHIFLSNYWWQRSDIWSQASYRNPILWEAFFDPSDSQTGSRNLTGPKTLPTIWHTYMKLETKYHIFAIDSCWEQCDEKYHGRTDRVKQYTPLPLFVVYGEKLYLDVTGDWPTYLVDRVELLIIPPLPGGGGGYTVLLCPSVHDIFRHIVLSNYRCP
jgi:hypothetical protein